MNPKTDIEAEEFFTSEDGFKSALTGLYSMMVLEKSYGRQMTFDFVGSWFNDMIIMRRGL